jgi:protein-S-isoprenylcysteine O-methyltransferase Ste14
MAVLVTVQMTLELAIRKVHLRPSTGLLFSRDQFRGNFSIGRSLVKLAGFFGTLAALALIYRFVPMYSNNFHRSFWEVVRVLWPYVLFSSIPYFILLDALMIQPRDGYWHLAQLLALRHRNVDWTILKEHALGWVIKGFFLPLMVPYMIGALASFSRAPQAWTVVPFVYHIATAALLLDLAFVVIGYTFTVRILDSHIRSSNPFAFGWIACLVLYRPFWDVAGLRYSDGVEWYRWFENHSILLLTWAALIILAKLGWAWSNIIFGFRFSNLTNRGIITGGPYRWTKHPSYVFKNLGWWLLNVPFLSAGGFVPALKYSLALLGVNLLYFVRAKSEEMHLSEDPTYVAYAEWINDNGLFRWAGRLIPAMRYQAPPALGGQSGSAVASSRRT